MSIIGRPVAGKLQFKVFVRDVQKNSKGYIHPSNIVHIAYLEFDLHTTAYSTMMR